MGLDITAHSELKLVQMTEEEYEDKWENHVRLDQEEVFLPRCGGLAPGFYEVTQEPFGFRAGSYGGYNGWRDRLCRFVKGVSAEQFWAAKSPDSPFMELINFSDCEGYIGGTVAAKLARDFDEWERKAQDALDDYDFLLYKKWQKAFHMAANNGAVRFH